MPRRTVLITAAGSSTAVNIIKQAAALPSIRVVTTDVNPAALLPAAKLWSVAHYQVPSAADREEFMHSLASICLEQKVDFLYPVHDSEIACVFSERHRIPKSTALPDLSFDAVQRCVDKWSTYETCVSAGIPTPETWLGSGLPDDIFKRFGVLVRKPREGVGSLGMRYVRDYRDLDAASDLNDQVIYQPLCRGREFTVDVLRTKEKVYAVARERVETKLGVCTKARVSVLQSASSLAEKISEAFCLYGLFCFQIFIESPSLLSVIDINPRCGGGTALTAAAGFPIYEMYLSHSLGLEDGPAFAKRLEDQMSRRATYTVCRYYDEVVTAVNYG